MPPEDDFFQGDALDLEVRETDTELNPESDAEQGEELGYPDSVERRHRANQMRDYMNGMSNEEWNGLGVFDRIKRVRKGGGSVFEMMRQIDKKVQAFMLASSIAGIAGGIYNYMTPPEAAGAEVEQAFMDREIDDREKELEGYVRNLESREEEILPDQKLDPLDMGGVERYIELHGSSDSARDVLLDVADANPDGFVQLFDAIADKPYAQEVSDVVIESNPLSIRYAPDGMNAFIDSSESATVQLAHDIVSGDYSRSDTSVLLKSAAYIASDRFEGGVDEALDSISSDERWRDRILMDIIVHGTDGASDRAENNMSGKMSIRVEAMNADHELSDKERFSEVIGGSSVDMYATMAYGGDQAYRSTAARVFDYFSGTLGAEDQGMLDFVEGVDGRGTADFMKNAAKYDKLANLWHAETESNQDKLADVIVENALDHGEIDAVAQLIVMEGDPEVRQDLQDSLERHFEAAVDAGDDLARDTYGTLSAFYGEDASWLGDQLERYEVGTQDRMDSRELMDENGDVFQIIHIFNDSDGRYALSTILDEYSEDAGWTHVDHGSFLEIAKDGEVGNVTMYVNKPEASTKGTWLDLPDHVDDVMRDADGSAVDGHAAIRAHMVEQDQNAAIEVIRGHSGMGSDAIKDMGTAGKTDGFSASIVIEGTCGGVGQVPAILEAAPGATVIYNTDTGKGELNNATHSSINDSILSGGMIEWADVRAEVESEIEERYDGNSQWVSDARTALEGYVFPHSAEAGAANAARHVGKLADFARTQSI